MDIHVEINERQADILAYALSNLRFNFNERVKDDLSVDRAEGEKEIDDLAELLGITIDYDEPQKIDKNDIIEEDVRLSCRLRYIEK